MPPPPPPPPRQGRELAIVDISKATSVISEDVIDTMTRLGMLKYSDGEHQIIATPVRLFAVSYCRACPNLRKYYRSRSSSNTQAVEEGLGIVKSVYSENNIVAFVFVFGC